DSIAAAAVGEEEMRLIFDSIAAAAAMHGFEPTAIENTTLFAILACTNCIVRSVTLSDVNITVYLQIMEGLRSSGGAVVPATEGGRGVATSFTSRDWGNIIYLEDFHMRASSLIFLCLYKKLNLFYKKIENNILITSMLLSL
ncbi:hypothetical protein ACJX0J_023177, partial [Zea mays]